jgi:predicted nucleotidyltransferase
MSQSEAINIVRKYIDMLRVNGIEINKAILYGSYARDEATLESDIDVMLVSKMFDTDDDYILSKPWLYSADIDHRIEPYSVGLKKYESGDFSPILDIIELEGIEIEI